MIKAEVSVRDIGRDPSLPSYDLKNDLTGKQTLEDFFLYVKTLLIVVADKALAEEQAQGFTKEPSVFVDGRLNKPVSAVKPFGKIEFVDRTLFTDREIFITTYKKLLDMSPVLEGDYINSHLVTFNGAIVAANITDLERWLDSNPPISDGGIVRFINIQPYARKLERYGVTRGRTRIRQSKSRDKQGRSGEFVKVPNGVYWQTYRSVRRLYKRARFIKFDFVPGESLGSFRGRAISESRYSSKGNLRGRRENAAGVGRTYLYPSITIRF